MHPNNDPSSADLWLIRHAPAQDGGAMAGRRDVDADCSDVASIAAMRAVVAQASEQALWASPARRCAQTAAALWPNAAPQQDARLWEQDFGAWEGLPYADLPDIGPLQGAALAQFAPPQGESFADLCARVWPFYQGLGAGHHVIVAHAGVIRAALGLALGAAHLGLGFSLAPLSLTRLRRDLSSSTWAVVCTNWTAQ
ncbi:MAG: histidine phosphatase family protein [Cypionkella sp.]|nr:histidine phosphatase family protein [Cypionkella sp.]